VFACSAAGWIGTFAVSTRFVSATGTPVGFVFMPVMVMLHTAAASSSVPPHVTTAPS
jgi:hypothetical protein